MENKKPNTVGFSALKTPNNVPCVDNIEGIQTLTGKFPDGLLSGERENVFEEDNSLIKNESSYIKTFPIPMKTHFPKKVIFISVIAILILLVTSIIIFWSVNNERSNAGVKECDSTISVAECSVGENPYESKKETLLKYMLRISGSKIISGLYDSTTSSCGSLQTLHKITGVFPGMISISMPSPSAVVSEWNKFIEDMISNWNNGTLVGMVWWGGNPLVTSDIYKDTGSVSVNGFKWESLINNGRSLNQGWKEQLDLIVPCLKQLETAGVILIVDFLPTINQKSFMGAGRPGINGTSKLYKITHDYLTKKHNLTSLIWTWSLLRDHLSNLEEYWPGSDYVDVASVHMWSIKELPILEYQRLVNILGNKPMSMENMRGMPTSALLAAQPAWTWFTITDKPHASDYNNIRNTFNSASVINRGNIAFFDDAI